MRRIDLRRWRLGNLIQTGVLLGGMGVILWLVGWLIGGRSGAVWGLFLGLAALVLSPRISPRWLLRLYRARPLTSREAPVLHELLGELSARAGLPAPMLYFVPSAVPNAFSVGEGRNGAVAVTNGLVEVLSVREIAGVLAHELSHLGHNDVSLMNLADAVSRVTSMFSLFGQILVLLNLPFMVAGQVVVSWWLIAVLIAAPYLAGLLQLAVSRTREFDADIGAVGLTGDPRGLASALAKIEAYGRAGWKRLFLPRHGAPQPSVLRTHPHTAERVKRLLALEEGVREEGAMNVEPGAPARLLKERPAVRIRRPRWHIGGLWY